MLRQNLETGADGKPDPADEGILETDPIHIDVARTLDEIAGLAVGVEKALKD